MCGISNNHSQLPSCLEVTANKNRVGIPIGVSLQQDVSPLSALHYK